MPTISQIFEQNNNVSGKLLLQTDTAKKCYFIPWVKLKKKHCGKIMWLGEYRWWGNNNRSIDIIRVTDSEKYHLIQKIPILPKNHPIRIELEIQVKIENGIYKMTDNDIMPFGKFKGEKMANIPPEYLLWFFEHGNGYASVRGYIRDNLDVIKAEIKLKNKTGEK